MGEVSWFNEEKVKGKNFLTCFQTPFQPLSKCSTLALVHFLRYKLKNSVESFIAKPFLILL